MRRRFFLFAAGAAALAAAFVAAVPGASRAKETIDYAPGAIEEALASGKAVLVDYAADWCSTCRAQARVIEALRAENPAYDESIVFIRVDWDRYRREPVTTDRRIPRRSTLVLLRGEEELGRIVAGTSRSTIEELLDQAL